MQEQPLIAVRGEIVLEVEPEIARLEVSIVARDTERTRAMQLLEDRADTVDKILASFPDVIDRIETSGLRVSPQLSNAKPPSHVAGYLGLVRQTIAVTGFDRIGELMSQLAGQEQTEVGTSASQPGLPAGQGGGGRGCGTAGQGLRAGAGERACRPGRAGRCAAAVRRRRPGRAQHQVHREAAAADAGGRTRGIRV